MLSRRSTFPRRGPVSERIFGKAYAEAEHGGSSLAAGLFAIALFLFIASLSVYEVTEPDRARGILAAGIGSITDVDRTLQENLPALREEARISAEPALELPGYPLPVTLTRLEALTSDDATLRALVLDRSADLVYATGLDAFDETGEQATELFSFATLIRELVGFLTGNTHGRAQWVALASFIAAALTGTTTLALNRGFARFTAFGAPILLASALGYLLTRGGSEVLTRFGSGDAFIVDLQTIALAMVDVPERNFLITGVLGLIITLSGWLLGLIADRFFSDESLDPAEYDVGPVLPFTAVPGPAHDLSAHPAAPSPLPFRLPGLPGLSALRDRLAGLAPSSRPGAASPPPPPEPEVGGTREPEVGGVRDENAR